MKVPPVVILVIRLFLGIVFVTYGVVKLLGGQYYYGDFVIDSKTVGGPFLVWAFFGYSKIYALFTGVGEFVAGLLLLIPRTRTMGAAVLFPVTLSITVMTFAFGFPGVKYFSLLLTTLCALLLLYDFAKLKLIFWDDRELASLSGVQQPEIAAPTPAAIAPRRKWAMRLAAAVVLLPVIGFMLNAAVASLTPGPEEKALFKCLERGWKKDDLVFRRSSYGGGNGFNRRGFVLYEVKGSNPPKQLRVEVNRPHSFVDWQILQITEEPKPQ